METEKQDEKISTLYSLSSDIENSCDDFCKLKEALTSAIIETENLINKVNAKEIELTKEQKMFITEQSYQLKNLGKNLSQVTTELAFQLSDLSNIMATGNSNVDTLNLKYLVVLDNLVNGNEMLQSSLNSINLINQMFNANSTLPSNNQGRILYGFQHNNEEPVIKDYYINENGELVNNCENCENQENGTSQQNHSQENNNETNSTIDTYQNRALSTNIDTYQNTNVPKNIDSFFNTALLNNEFMYGNGAYAGFNGPYGMNNPYINNYNNYQNNATNSAKDNNNTQDEDIKDNTQETNNERKKEERRIRFKKNIDTYKDENEPDIKTKLGNIKNSITNFFGKIDLDSKIKNPVARENITND